VNEAGSRVQCLFNGSLTTYFETLGIRILAGRDFTSREIESAEP